MSDRRGKSVYVFYSERIFRRFQRLVQADFRFVSDGVFADKPDVLRTADMADQYAAGTWNYACGERSAENCTAVRTGYKCESKHDECDKHSKYGCSCRTVRGEKTGLIDFLRKGGYNNEKD